MTTVLEMQGITKRFPGVLANDNIDFSLKKGEVHALLGENGAGKSTLMNVLYGMYRPEEGEIILNNQKVTIREPIDAIDLGIGMVHQHFMLVPVMTVAENMIIGNETVKYGAFLDIKTAVKKIKSLSEKYGLEIDPNAYIKDLPVGIRQRVEILKTLYRNADILILDEPTAVLTPEESESLFVTLKTMTEIGKSIIFITHKLKEVKRFADRITVMRGGKKVLEANPDDMTEEKLASEMVGKDVSLIVEKGPANPGETVLEVKNLTYEGKQNVAIVDNISFEIRSGEILGLAGVQGNGQGELIACLTGLSKCSQGIVRLNGKKISNFSPRKITNEGVSHIPEDRHTYGMVDSFPITDNLILNSYQSQDFSGKLFIKEQAVRSNAEKVIQEFDIKTPDIYVPAGNLSGGNQQKMVAARELSRDINLLIAAHPTRGLDVGSAAFIHEQIVKIRDRGCAVLLVSAELDEIFALSDRIAVMYKGRIIDSARTDAVDLNTVGMWMAGIRQKAS